jgi:hypothetical protein
MINRNVGRSKLSVVKMASEIGILVPDSKLSLSPKDDKRGWIEKRINSIGGIGIMRARGRSRIKNKYYQKFVSDRDYELRVHAFSWIDSNKWSVQKRHGDRDKIAWNHRNGGYFRSAFDARSTTTAKALAVSKKILGKLSMQFGAIDFIVSTGGDLYFLEINSAPGFEELSKSIYVNAFRRLTKMSLFQLKRHAG